jgi:hypothetical protein
MKMSQHTPGPWFANLLFSGAWQINSAESRIVANIPTSQSMPTEANARLIAAAPDLLAACKAALNRLLTDGYEPKHHGGEVLTDLQVAIAKVEGK